MKTTSTNVLELHGDTFENFRSEYIIYLSYIELSIKITPEVFPVVTVKGDVRSALIISFNLK